MTPKSTALSSTTGTCHPTSLAVLERPTYWVLFSHHCPWFASSVHDSILALTTIMVVRIWNLSAKQVSFRQNRILDKSCTCNCIQKRVSCYGGNIKNTRNFPPDVMGIAAVNCKLNSVICWNVIFFIEEDYDFYTLSTLNILMKKDSDISNRDVTCSSLWVKGNIKKPLTWVQ